MFRIAVALLFLAAAAAVLGFGLLADLTYDAAKVLFVVFLVLAVIAFIADAFRVTSPDPA